MNPLDKLSVELQSLSIGLEKLKPKKKQKAKNEKIASKSQHKEQKTEDLNEKIPDVKGNEIQKPKKKRSKPPPKDGEVSNKKTPYQGKSRSFGKYKCHMCYHQWASAASWANYGQICFKCPDVFVYPYTQERLKRSPQKKSGNHQRGHCQKCIEIGKSCTVKVAVKLNVIHLIERREAVQSMQ